MNTTTTKARQAIRHYIGLRGFEVIEDGWAYGQDRIDSKCPRWLKGEKQ